MRYIYMEISFIIKEKYGFTKLRAGKVFNLF